MCFQPLAGSKYARCNGPPVNATLDGNVNVSDGKPCNVTVFDDENVKNRYGCDKRKFAGSEGRPDGCCAAIVNDRFVSGGALLAGSVIVSAYPATDGKPTGTPVEEKATEAVADCGDDTGGIGLEGSNAVGAALQLLSARQTAAAPAANAKAKSVAAPADAVLRALTMMSPRNCLRNATLQIDSRCDPVRQLECTERKAA